MFLCIVSVFLACNTPFMVSNVWEGYVQDGNKVEVNALWYIGNLFVILNSSVNFIIYCLLGTKIRTIFKQNLVLGLGSVGKLLKSFLKVQANCMKLCFSSVVDISNKISLTNQHHSVTNLQDRRNSNDFLLDQSIYM